MPHSSVSTTVSKPKHSPVLALPAGVNTSLHRMEYAVRGELVQRAERIAQRLYAHPSDYPFDKIVYCNIGNPQSVGQTPITYVRQTLAAVTFPGLLSHKVLPQDLSVRAAKYLKSSHGIGAYSESGGLKMIRQSVANAIERRDGVPCNPDQLFFTNGASEAVKIMLQIIIRNESDGVMIPIPQYPLYSATLTALNGQQVNYLLDEQNSWAMDVNELELRLKEARSRGVCVRALCVINPGNPTGQVLSRQNLEQVVRFCERERLVILADEVYQKNVYGEKPFISFKKVVADLQSPVELASFHSVSKGLLGECGIRGGYVEVVNMRPEVEALIYKTISVSLCSNVTGQIALDLMMNPPREQDESYELYERESSLIYGGLKRKSQMLAHALNAFKGVECNPSEGAMYLFPRITLPEGAIREAEKRGLECADVLYCLEMLDATGICVVPGSGFGQREGTYHFRTTFLPPELVIEEAVGRMRKFHSDFLQQYE